MGDKVRDKIFWREYGLVRLPRTALACGPPLALILERSRLQNNITGAIFLILFGAWTMALIIDVFRAAKIARDAEVDG